MPARLGAFARKSGKRSIGIAQKITLGVLMASLFLPVFLFSPTKEISIVKEASAAGCEINTTIGVGALVSNGLTSYDIKSGKSIVNKDEKFELYLEANVKKDLWDSCKQSGGSDYKFSYYLYLEPPNGACEFNLYPANYQTAKSTEMYSTDSKQGFRVKPTLTLSELVSGNAVTGIVDKYKYCLYGYFHKGAIGRTTRSIGHVKIQVDNSTNEHPSVTLPEAGAGNTVINNNETVDYNTLKVAIKPKDSKGLRKKYRVLKADSSLTFGSGGADPVYAGWDGKGVAEGQYFSLPKKDDNSTGYDFTPYYRSSTIYFNYADALKGKKIACEPSTFSEDCSGIVFRAKDSSSKGKESAPKALPTDGSLVEFNPVIYSAAWNGKLGSSVKAEVGKPLGSVEFVALPGINGTKSLASPFIFDLFKSSGVVLVLGSGDLQKFTVEVFNDIKDIQAACEAEKTSAEDKEKCKDPNYAKYGFAETIEQTTSSDEAKENPGASDLFAFLRKVVAYIILLITSTIYWIFAIILVPILNALLQIRPYQDEFVNFIYPGWVILRNVANIGFIIALLWMGLRVLFQVDDSGKTRGFIMWLVIMALLVNFSLVIGQGVVGIADTVQAQFLPGDSRVIEALGHKLMVDPIKLFGTQSQTANLTPEGNEFSASAAASDITKPFVMLILAVAAFFAFIALIAFILVRLVALWILYMLAPVAYVARILPDTKQWWDKWWSEFIKYAFTVPILAFFLNITALMATTFALRNGDSVIAGRDRNYILGPLVNNAQAEIVEYAVTVISHFIVLVFLFIGMKFAMSSGHAGAEKIVGAAKKGFDFVTKTAPAAIGRGAGKAALWGGRWAKDTGADSLARSKMFKDSQRAQNIIRGIARPVDAFKALKKGYIDNPKEEMNKRFTDQFKKLTNQVQPWGEDKLFPAKMAYWKLTGQDYKIEKARADAMLNNADNLREQATIMDDSDKVDLVNKRGEIATEKTNDENELAQAKAKFSGDIINIQNGILDVAQASGLVNDFDPLINDKEAQIAQLVEQEKVARKDGNIGTADKLLKDIADATDERDVLKVQQKSLKDAVDRSVAAGNGEVDVSGLTTTIAPVFDMAAAEQEISDSFAEIESQLNDKIEKANDELTKLQVTLDNDNDLRDKFGMDRMSGMNPALRDRLLKQADELVKQAGETMVEAQRKQKPMSVALEAAEAEEAREHQKKMEWLDTDQLTDGLKKALKSNNLAMARAYYKQLADNGALSVHMEREGYENNVEGLARMIKDAMPKASDRTQIAVIRELSMSSAKNGNTALGDAVKSLPGGGGMVNSIAAQQKVLGTKKVKSLFEMKTGDIFYTDNSGVKQFNAGAEAKIKSYDTEKKAELVRKDLDAKIADTILDKYVLKPSELKAALGEHLGSALVNVAKPKFANDILSKPEYLRDPDKLKRDFGDAIGSELVKKAKPSLATPFKALFPDLK